MTYHAKRQNKKALGWVIVLFFGGAVSFALGAMQVGWRAGWQILAILLLTLGIQLTQRYLLSEYEYILTSDADLSYKNDITIVRVQGKRRTSMGNLTLMAAAGLEKNTKRAEIEKKYGQVSQIFNFCPDISPADEYVLVVSFNGNQAMVRLQCSEEFAKELKVRIPQR